MDEIEKKIDRAMAQEGFKLTREDKKDINEVVSGEKTYDEKREEIKQKVNQIKEYINREIKENEDGIQQKR